MLILFYKTDLAWPRRAGHDVHTYNLMRALHGLGVEVGLATAHPSRTEAVERLPLALGVCLNEANWHFGRKSTTLTGLRERFRSYWGMPQELIERFAALVVRLKPDAVVASGLDVLPMLSGVDGPVRVWYAGDEWLWHHLSQVKVLDPSTWREVRAGAIKGLYERAFRCLVDRAWAVSRSDARAIRWVAGIPNVDVVPNGVDAETFVPRTDSERPESAVFWGRLDFGPNVQALEWFCARVWPVVHRRRPNARFTIIGFNPTARVQRLTRCPGVELVPNAEDIRVEAARRAVVVLPMVSGGGIKNKLLEAAAMAKPVICTRRALSGLLGRPPVRVADSLGEWVAALMETWDSRERRSQMGALAREWVVREHTWRSAAEIALAGIQASLAERKAVRASGPPGFPA